MTDPIERKLKEMAMVTKPKPKKPSKVRKAAKAAIINPGSLAGLGGAMLGAANFVTGPGWKSGLMILGTLLSGLGTTSAAAHGATEKRSGS